MSLLFQSNIKNTESLEKHLSGLYAVVNFYLFVFLCTICMRAHMGLTIKLRVGSSVFY